MPLITCPDCKKEISDAAPACIHCGRPMQRTVPVSTVSAAPMFPAPLPSPTTHSDSSSLARVGVLLLILGGIGLIYAFNMETSVETAFGAVNNIGLLNERQTYLILSGGASLVGLLLAAIGSAKKG